MPRVLPCPPMPAPIAVVLAAGQGTRMRSETPKVLHPICGLPMVLWPVHAALEAGAQKVVVVGGPDRALEPILPPGVELAVQAEPRGTGDAVRAAAPQLEDPDTTILVLNGDVPLITTDAIAGLAPKVRPHLVDDPTLTLGINDRADLAAVTQLAQQRILRRHMLAGVTIVHPPSTIIEAGVTIGQDTVIEPFATIKGQTTIGAGCRIAHSYLDGATVHDGVTVG